MRGLPIRILLLLLLSMSLVLVPAGRAAAGPQDQQEQKTEKKDKKKKNKESQEGPIEPKDINREVTRMVRDLQFGLEGGSSRSVLSLIDSAKFDDYPRFEDMIERLTREDVIRANFRTANTSPNAAEGKAQTTLDAEIEIGRKDSTGPPQRRRQQLVLDLENTKRGWRITNITPRDFFQPL